MKVVTYEPEFSRPGLPVPLSPLRGFAGFARRDLLGLRRPGFAGAHRVTAASAAAGFALAIVSLPLPPPWQWVIVACSALAGMYVIVRALALVAFERQQRAFERQWLAAQSEVLRGHAFEILRFTASDLSGMTGGRHAYDLTRPADVRDLLRKQNRARQRDRPTSRATVEFGYLTGDGTLAVADVHRELPELSFLEGWAGPGRATIRFPEARYLPGPERGRRPARQAYWVLSGPAMIAVSESAYGGAAGSARGPGAPAENSGFGLSR